MPRMKHFRGRVALLVAILAGASAAFVLATRPPGTPDDVVVRAPETGPVPGPVTEPAVETAESAAVALERLRTQIAAAREQGAERAGGVADLLLRAAELHRELGQDREARAVYEEVRHLDPAGQRGGWRARDAVRRLLDLDAEVGRPLPEREQLREARELHRTAAALAFRGRYLPAVPLCERALATRRRLLTAPHQDLAASLLLLGELQANRGELYDKAFDTLTEAREGCRRTFGPDHPATGACLHGLAVLEDERGAFVEAQGLYDAALEVFRRTCGEFSREYAMSLARLGRMHRDWWVTGAQEKMTRAMQIRETVLGPNHPDLADSLQDLGIQLFNSVRLEQAKALFLRAKTIRDTTLTPDHPATVETLGWLGSVLLDEADFTVAHEYNRRAAAVAERAHGPDHPAVARALTRFGALCYQENDFDRGEVLFLRALAIYERRRLTDHPDYADTLRARARNLDEWAFAVLYWEGRQVDVRPAHDAYERAVRRFEQLAEAARLPGFAGALVQQASLYYVDSYRLRTQAEARAMIARAREMMAKVGTLDSHPFYRDLLTVEEMMARYNGDYETTARIIDRMESYTRGRYGSLFPYQVLFSVYQRFGLELHRGPRAGGPDPKIVGLYGDMQSNLSVLIDRFNRGQSTAARLGTVFAYGESVSAALSAAIDHTLPVDPYRFVLVHHGNVAAAQVVDRLAHDRPELKQQLGDLGRARRQLVQTLYSPPRTDADRAAWIAELQTLSNLKDDLESEIAFKAREGASVPRPEPSVADVQTALPAKAVLIEYCGYMHMRAPPGHRGRLDRVPELVAFVIHKDRPAITVPLGPRAAIETAVADWRGAVAAVQRGAPGADLPTRTAAVAKLLWEPLRAHLGTADTLFIAPDGPACLIPFGALPGRKAGSYLIEDYRIGYLPAGRTLAAPPPERVGQGLLTVSGIEYGATAGGTHPALKALPRLAFDTLETRGVSAQFRHAGLDGEVRHLTDRHATVEGFATAVANRPRFIHYAGHGFFAAPTSFPDLTDGPAGRSGLFRSARTGHPAVLRNRPLLSGLVLAPGPRPADRLLTAEQVSGFDLRGTELVVLSACETGVGDVALGEGAMSLQRAFLTAGARTVVGSLWKVEDAGTAVLMEELYRNLWDRKQTKIDALRNAQLTVLRHPERIALRAEQLRSIDTTAVRPLPPAATGGTADPTLWASFILIGDAR